MTLFEKIKYPVRNPRIPAAGNSKEVFQDKKRRETLSTLPNRFRSVAFWSEKTIGFPIGYFGAQHLQLLLSACLLLRLRLKKPVAQFPPRLSTGGWLGLSGRDSHPLYVKATYARPHFPVPRTLNSRSQGPILTPFVENWEVLPGTMRGSNNSRGRRLAAAREYRKGLYLPVLAKSFQFLEEVLWDGLLALYIGFVVFSILGTVSAYPGEPQRWHGMWSLHFSGPCSSYSESCWL